MQSWYSHQVLERQLATSPRAKPELLLALEATVSLVDHETVMDVASATLELEFVYASRGGRAATASSLQMLALPIYATVTVTVTRTILHAHA